MSGKATSGYFLTEQAANEYKVNNKLFGRVPEYSPGRGWALVFPIKANIQVIPHTQGT